MSTKTHGHHHPSNTPHNGNAAPAEHLAEHHNRVNQQERFSLIKIRAYGLWEQAGKPDGDSAREKFWSEAEGKVLASETNGE